MRRFSISQRRGWSILQASFFFISALALIVGEACAQSAGNSSAPATPILTRAIDVHNLPAALTAHARVHLVATVTYYDPLDNVLFVEDASGGVFVGTSKTYPLKIGDLVDITGGTLPGYRTEVAPDPVIRVVGRGPNYAARRVDYAELATGRQDSQLVVIRGKVRSADFEQHENATYVRLDVGIEGEEVEVYLSSSARFDPHSVIGDFVEITAIAGGVFDAKSQLTGIVLYATDASAIRTIVNAPKASADLPLTEIDRVFEKQRIDDTSPRIRVRGTVTYYRRGDSAVLEQDGKSIYAQTRETNDISVGDVVDAYGIPSNREYAPSLRQATLVKTGGHEHIVPRPVTYADALSGIYSDNLISLSGILVSELHDAASNTLVLNVDGHLVNGSLPGTAPLLGTAAAAAAAPLPDFALGSRIRIAGICRIVPGGPWRAPTLFHLEMRTAADAQVLSEPSWWTVRHLAGLLGALLILALAITVWAVLLRKRVSHQTLRINRSMVITGERSKILEKISSNHDLDLLLSEICKSIMALLPGFACSYTLHTKSPDHAGAAPSRRIRRGDQIYFETNLAAANDRLVGRIVVSGPPDLQVPEDQQQVYATLLELATLAVERSELHQQLVHHSTHDSLTELPNRRLCEDRLQSALKEAAKENTQLAVIYIDVNRFKHVNDRYGHRVGDLYLKQISTRLQEQMRSVDTLARIGGDEFLIIAPVGADADAAASVVSRLQRCFEKPFRLEEESIDGSASFGLAVYPQDGATASELKRSADQAMYVAKRKASGAPALAEDIAIVAPDELELAVTGERFRLAYQPQFSAQGRLTGLEALIRMEDPILGTLTPDAFISVAERHDVIIRIGEWVLRRAIQDAIRWGLHLGESSPIVVNVSVRQLEQSNFADNVDAILHDYAYPAGRLELEITERTFISNSGEVLRQINQLRATGIRISLDDFGTGQSSLSLLHKLPIDTIKLDRSFIRAVDTEPNVWPIIKAIASMAGALGKRIVAEGIEHTGPVPALLKMGEIEFQGYLLGRPILAAEVDAMIEDWRIGIKMPTAFGKPDARRKFRLR